MFSPKPDQNDGWVGGASSHVTAPHLSRRTSTQAGSKLRPEQDRAAKAEKDALKAPPRWSKTRSSSAATHSSLSLPRWARGVRAFAALMFLLVVGYLAFHILSRPEAARKQARKAAIHAENLLQDPNLYRPQVANARGYSPAYLKEKLRWPFAKGKTKGKTSITDSSPPATHQQSTVDSNTYHPNGLLVAHAENRHPILLLIEKAEREWKAKEANQSKTLEQAVKEYKRRYHRNPPKGFEKWSVTAEVILIVC